jgi:hypothetical protein
MHELRISLVLALLGSLGQAALASSQPDQALDLKQCSTYSWSAYEKVPIFDPLASPSSEQALQELKQLDSLLREQADKLLAKYGWRLVAAGDSACQVEYSLLQAVDLEVARFSGSAPAPRNSSGVGGSLETGLDAHLERKGTLTIEVRSAETGRRLWRGDREAKLGKKEDVAKNLKKLVEATLKEMPRR